MASGRAVIVGCLKNSEQFLPSVFLNLQKLASLYEEVAYVFVENDSRDLTKQILKEWGAQQKSFQLISFDGLDAYETHRTVRLEIARNAYIHAVISNPSFHDFDELIVMDMDDRGSFPLNEDHLSHALSFLRQESQRAAVFANQPMRYYDLWALRHPQLCPFDFWHEVLRAALKLPTDQAAFDAVYSKIPHRFAADSEPIQVESAFGGLGIYKMKFIRDNKSRYIGHEFLYLDAEPMNFTKLQTCEHVSFHAGISAQGGELYILPYLINSVDDTSFLPAAYKTILIRSS